MPQRALVLLATNFEEIEAICPIDLLRRAAIEVVTASLESTLEVTGRSGISLVADQFLSALSLDSFDILVIPGGPAVFELRKRSEVLTLIQSFHQSGKAIGAICAAPLLLLDAGIMESKQYTAHGSVCGELPALIENQPVIADGCIITSRGAGTAVEFGLKIIAHVLGEIKAEEIRQSIHA